MSEYISSYDRSITQYKQGKIEISNFAWDALHVGLFGVFAFNALCNAFYGSESGDTWYNIAILVIGYLAAELCLLGIAARYVPREKTATMAKASGVGLFIISAIAGISFFIGQHQKSDNYQITQRESQIKQLELHISELPPTWVVNRSRLRKEIRILQAEIDELIEAQGGYASGSTAIYAYISKATGISKYTVTVLARGFCTLVLVLTGVTMAGVIRDSYCPKSLDRFATRLKGNIIAENRRKTEFIAALSKEKGLEVEKEGKSPVLHYSAAPRAPKRSTGVREGRSYDTGTSGQNSARYEDIKSKVTAGEVEPVVKSIRRAGNCGANTARGYLQAMAGEGVLQSKQTARGIQYSLN